MVFVVSFEHFMTFRRTVFEDENENRLRWCYPPSFAKNLTLPVNDHSVSPLTPLTGAARWCAGGARQ